MRLAFLSCVTAAIATFAIASPAAADGLTWAAVSAENTPASAFSATPDGTEPVRVCRVRHRRDMEIGTVRDYYCHIGGDGMNRPYSIYELLVEAPGASWAAAEGGTLPAGALPLNNDHGPAVYACRTNYEGQVLVGLVRETICSAGIDGSELRSDNFEVLVAKTD